MRPDPASVCRMLRQTRGSSCHTADKIELLNASYDVSRELFAQVNPAFQSAWHAQTGQEIEIRQSDARQRSGGVGLPRVKLAGFAPHHPATFQSAYSFPVTCRPHQRANAGS